jgi:tetrahydrodipicolinate N-succinyltransferase
LYKNFEILKCVLFSFPVQVWKNFGKCIPKFFSKAKKFRKHVQKYLFKDKNKNMRDRKETRGRKRKI